MQHSKQLTRCGKKKNNKEPSPTVNFDPPVPQNKTFKKYSNEHYFKHTMAPYNKLQDVKTSNFFKQTFRQTRCPRDTDSIYTDTRTQTSERNHFSGESLTNGPST